MEKLPSGSYRDRVRYKDKNGKTRQKSFTASTKKEVKQLIAEWMMQEKVRQESEPDPDDITVAEALEQYIAVKEPVLSPSTIRGYEQCRLKYFDDLGQRYISTLTSKDMQQFIADLSLTRSPKTVRNIYGFLSAALDMFAPEKRFKVTLPAKKIVTRTVPTDEQVKRLLDAASPEMKIAIVLGSLSLRRGEVCALKYEDIYPDLNMIYVHADIIQNKYREWVYKDIPKTSASVRSITVPKEVISLINPKGKSGYIVPLKPSSVTWNFCDLRDKLQVKVSFHSLRRYCASLLHALGVPDKYIQRVGGWASPSVMRQCYENVLEDKNIEFTKKMTDYYKDTFSDQIAK